jgi:hypothetical protein
VDERRRAVEAIVLDNMRRYVAGEPLLHVAHAGSE